MDEIIARFLDRYSVAPANAGFDRLVEIARAFSFLPYENVTKILKAARSASVRAGMRLAPEVLEDHLRWNTGGTCFSLCNALLVILRQSGVPSFVAMADMHYGRNIHCVVIAECLERRYVLDPGYLIGHPVPLPDAGCSATLRTSMSTLIFEAEEAGTVSLYTIEAGLRKWRYRMRPWPVSDDEFSRHWIRSFSLNTIEHVMLSRLSSSGRLYFRKNRLEEVGAGGRSGQPVAAGESGRLSAVFGLPADLILQAHRVVLARPAVRSR
jgi:arylamine N-acetyltransferase